MKQDLKRVLNGSVSMRKVLAVVYGVDPSGDRPFPCPFPDHGSDDVHPSAKLYDESNTVYCFAEQRTYTVYDVLIAAGKTDADLNAFVVNELGGDCLMSQFRTQMKVEDFDQKIGQHLECTTAQFRRGEVPWVDVLQEVTGYFERICKD